MAAKRRPGCLAGIGGLSAADVDRGSRIAVISLIALIWPDADGTGARANPGARFESALVDSAIDRGGRQDDILKAPVCPHGLEVT